MNILFLLLPIALLMGIGALGAFVWSAHDGQYEDLDTPQVRILLDEEERKKT